MRRKITYMRYVLLLVGCVLLYALFFWLILNKFDLKVTETTIQALLTSLSILGAFYLTIWVILIGSKYFKELRNKPLGGRGNKSELDIPILFFPIAIGLVFLNIVLLSIPLLFFDVDACTGMFKENIGYLEISIAPLLAHFIFVILSFSLLIPATKSGASGGKSEASGGSVEPMAKSEASGGSVEPMAKSEASGGSVELIAKSEASMKRSS